MSGRAMTESFEDLLHCMICFETYRSPKMLACGHTFCQECLHGYYKTYQQQKRAQSGKLPCPTCRELTALPANGVAGLRNDFKVAKIEEMFRTVNIRKERGKAEGKVCDACKAQKKISQCKFYCSSCNMNYCKECIKKHNKNPVFKNHQVLSKGVTSSENVSCKVHKNEEGKFFCRTCEVVICTVCIMNEHDGHNVTEVEDLFNKHQEDVKNLQNVIDGKMVQLKRKSVELESLRTLNIQSCQQAEVRIKQRTKDMIGEIKAKEVELLDELRIKRDTKLETLSKEVDGVRFAVAKGSSLQDYASSTANRKSLRLIAVHDELVQRMRTMVEVDAYMDTDILSTVTFVPGKHNPDLGRIDEVRGTVDQLSKHPVVVAPPPMSPARSQTPNSSNGSGNGHENSPPHINRNISIIYTGGDTMRGLKLLLHVDRTGENMGELKDPLGVACLLNGDIAVAEWGNKRIQLFDSFGKTIRTFGAGNIGPQGIGVTLRGNLIISDANQKRLQVFTPSGNSIAKWGLGKFYAPCGVAISPNGNCIITDVAEHILSIYQGEKKLLKRIGSRGSGDNQFNNPLYVTTGLNNDIVVSDSDNHCIKIFDSHGHFKRKFGMEGSADGQLKYPRGVATDQDGNIIIVDRNNDRISMFSPNGRFIRHLLTRENKLRDPYAIAVSITGNLVVTESAANRAALKVYQMD